MTTATIPRHTCFRCLPHDVQEPFRHQGPASAPELDSMKLRKLVFPSVRLNTKACTGYGSCVSRCLLSGIERKEGETLPFFTESCVHCLECVSWRPRGAFEIDSKVKEWISTLSYRLGIH